MAKLRLIVGEVEGDDASVQAALKSMTDVMNRGDATISATAAPIAPVELPLLEPSKRGRGRPKKLAPATNGASAGDPILPTDGAAVAMVLTALKSGPKTSGDVIAACPKLNASQVYQTLSVLRLKRRVIVKADDEDGGQNKHYLA
jgi:hypothetical protein